MDKTSHLFDKWAKTGRAEEMEKGHGATVNKFLDKLVFDKPFTFLDIGCGNGWVVRKISQLSNCRSCLLYTYPSPRDGLLSRMPSSA